MIDPFVTRAERLKIAAQNDAEMLSTVSYISPPTKPLWDISTDYFMTIAEMQQLAEAKKKVRAMYKKKYHPQRRFVRYSRLST